MLVQMLGGGLQTNMLVARAGVRGRGKVLVAY